MEYECVIGLEIHVELATRTKAFCGCENRYGAEPNTCVCPVCAGLPGALPVLNREAVRLAVRAGLALGCRVNESSRFDRKNYFYPDLPKAYQITQFYRPLCEGGQVRIRAGGKEKTIGITRIHMEEDAGKLVHTPEGTLLDLNRCGVPLIEIVTEPEIRSAEEASACVRAIRAALVYAGVSGCRMDRGSLRCDVNLSLHAPGTPFGIRTEMKNLNSFQSVERAIRSEAARQKAVLESGGTVLQETRRFDQRTGETCAMRRKEDSADYRYFPEPDLPPLRLTPEDISAQAALLPELPASRADRLVRDCGLTPAEADLITQEKWLADYFDEACRGGHAREAAHLILGEAFALMAAADTQHTGERDASALPVSPEHMAALAALSAEEKINATTAKKILKEMFLTDCDPAEYAEKNGLFLLTDETALREAAQRAVRESPELVSSWLKGKQNAAKAVMGRAMALTRGRADARVLEGYVNEELEKLKA